jgi:hypothetical protein
MSTIEQIDELAVPVLPEHLAIELGLLEYIGQEIRLSGMKEAALSVIRSVENL